MNICKTCDKEFIPVGKSRGVYCSSKCLDNRGHALIRKIDCKTCGNEFSYKIKKSRERTYCSMECNILDSKQRKSKCIQCDKSFKYYLSEQAGKFCSKECSWKYKPVISEEDALKELKERFEKNYEVNGDCWDWIGATADTKNKEDLKERRYGHISYKAKLIKAHRASWLIYKGEIPKGMLIRHIVCDRPICVNPDHLEIGTVKDNMQDMVQKGRCADHRGEANNSAKLKESDVIEILSTLKNLLSIYEIAKKFNVHPVTIKNIINGKTWKHVTQ